MTDKKETVQARFLDRSPQEAAQDRAYQKLGLRPYQRNDKKKGAWPE